MADDDVSDGVDWRHRINECINDGGPEIVFQPIFSIEPHQLVGYEALSRFPVGNPIDWFIQAARVGLAYDLEMAAAAVALDQLDRIPADVYMAVNVSPGSVVDPRFAGDIGRWDLTQVVLELTEHDPVKDYGLLREALDPWRDDGAHVCTPVGTAAANVRRAAGNLRVSIDDLGAGFASMRHVLWLDPDFMKLDIDLVRGIDRSRRHRALASALTAFGEKMDVRLVAEGVESEMEYVTLRALDVHSVQGYLLGRPGPLPAEVPTADDLAVLIDDDDADLPEGRRSEGPDGESAGD